MMNHLLKAGMHRLSHEFLLKIVLVFSLAYGMFFAGFCQYFNVIEGGEFLIPLFAAMAAFISLTVGGEYHSGTIRNKVISGHTKTQILLSELILSTAVCIMMLLLFLLPVCILFHRLLQNIPMSGFCMSILSLIIAVVCYACLYTILTAMTGHQAIGLIACFVLTAAIVFASYECEFSLGQVEYIEIMHADENGMFDDEDIERIPNPHYVGGVTRNIIKFADGILPQGEVNGSMLYLGIMSKGNSLNDGIIDFSDAANVFRYPFYGAGVSVLSALIGSALYKKKELR